MSCQLTVDQVLARTKTVTRRHVDSWKSLKPGDRLTLIEKGMGLPKGAKQRILAEVEVVAVDVVQLYGISDSELAAEGFPDMEHFEFFNMWLDAHNVPTFRSQTEALEYNVRRIEWRYLETTERTEVA